MSPLLTNLLPPERIRRYQQWYLVRRITASATAGICLVIISFALLFPTHWYLQGQVAYQNAVLAQVAASRQSVGETLTTRVATLAQNAERIQALHSIPLIMPILTNVLQFERPGIVLSGMSYHPTGASQGTVILSGTAATRADLRSYQLILQNAAFVASAELPVSAYAKEKNIDFSIKVILKPV